MQVTTDILAVLSKSTIAGSALVLPPSLERKLYERTDKVLRAAGGKWDRKARAHVFAEDPTDIIDQTILTGAIVSAKTELGFFETPAPLAQRIVDLAQIAPRMRVFEPSAGRGAIAKVARDAGAIVDCCEVHLPNVRALRDDGFPVLDCDFLSVVPPDGRRGSSAFDRVVMNPPFAGQADIRHVTHAMKFLKPHGRLVAIMSAGVTFRENRLATDFRAMLDARGATVEKLPEGTFKSSGTNVNTVLVVIS
jgi:predicted RNA methylase